MDEPTPRHSRARLRRPSCPTSVQARLASRMCCWCMGRPSSAQSRPPLMPSTPTPTWTTPSSGWASPPLFLQCVNRLYCLSGLAGSRRAQSSADPPIWRDIAGARHRCSTKALAGCRLTGALPTNPRSMQASFEGVRQDWEQKGNKRPRTLGSDIEARVFRFGVDPSSYSTNLDPFIEVFIDSRFAGNACPGTWLNSTSCQPPPLSNSLYCLSSSS